MPLALESKINFKRLFDSFFLLLLSSISFCQRINFGRVNGLQVPPSSTKRLYQKWQVPHRCRVEGGVILIARVLQRFYEQVINWQRLFAVFGLTSVAALFNSYLDFWLSRASITQRCCCCFWVFCELFRWVVGAIVKLLLWFSNTAATSMLLCYRFVVAVFVVFLYRKNASCANKIKKLFTLLPSLISQPTATLQRMPLSSRRFISSPARQSWFECCEISSN